MARSAPIGSSTLWSAHLDAIARRPKKTGGQRGEVGVQPGPAARMALITSSLACMDCTCTKMRCARPCAGNCARLTSDAQLCNVRLRRLPPDPRPGTWIWTRVPTKCGLVFNFSSSSLLSLPIHCADPKAFADLRPLQRTRTGLFSWIPHSAAIASRTGVILRGQTITACAFPWVQPPRRFVSPLVWKLVAVSVLSCESLLSYTPPACKFWALKAKRPSNDTLRRDTRAKCLVPCKRRAPTAAGGRSGPGRERPPWPLCALVTLCPESPPTRENPDG